MAIYRLLERAAFSPEDIALLVKAYEDCLRTLKLPDQSDAKTEVVAKLVIELAQTGLRDPVQICRQVVERLGSKPAI